MPTVIHKHQYLIDYMLAIVVSFFCCLQIAIAQDVYTDPLQLNGQLQASGHVNRHKISPDSRYVVYQADQDEDNQFEIYSVRITGSLSGEEPVKLNGDLVSGEDVYDDYKISSDSQYVVYTVASTDGVFELFSVPITGLLPGEEPTKLNGELVDGESVKYPFKISPDGKHVIYRADQDTNDVFELYSVSITGGQPTRLNVDFRAESDVLDTYQISPDSQYVIYLTNPSDYIHDPAELYSVGITGGPVTKLNGDDMGVYGVTSFQVSNNNQHVVYRVSRALYSIPIVGGNPFDSMMI